MITNKLTNKPRQKHNLLSGSKKLNSCQLPKTLRQLLHNADKSGSIPCFIIYHLLLLHPHVHKIRVHSLFFYVLLVTIFSNTFHHSGEVLIIGEVFIIGEVYIVVGEVFIIGEVPIVVGGVFIIGEIYSIVSEVLIVD